MSECIEFEILDTDDVRNVAWDVVSDSSVLVEDFDERVENWVDYNLADWIHGNLEFHDEYTIRCIATESVEEARRRESINLEEIDARVEALETEQLAERVEALERVNAKLLETLSQFSQLLTHRDLI